MFPSNSTNQKTPVMRQEELTEKIIGSVKDSRTVRAVQQRADEYSGRVDRIAERMSGVVESILAKLHLDRHRIRR